MTVKSVTVRQDMKTGRGMDTASMGGKEDMARAGMIDETEIGIIGISTTDRLAGTMKTTSRTAALVKMTLEGLPVDAIAMTDRPEVVGGTAKGVLNGGRRLLRESCLSLSEKGKRQDGMYTHQDTSSTQLLKQSRLVSLRYPAFTHLEIHLRLHRFVQSSGSKSYPSSAYSKHTWPPASDACVSVRYGHGLRRKSQPFPTVPSTVHR